MIRYTLSALLFIGLCTLQSAAQGQGNIYVEDSSIHIVQQGMQRSLAWAGGFNNPQFATADLNKDGLIDLVAYEWRDQVIKTFLNVGTASAAKYIYAPRYAANFPKCLDYMKLEDYNRDGIKDLIDKGTQGFEVFRGYYNSANELCFTKYKDLRYISPIPGLGSINAYTQASDIPGIVDVDGDGDLDFFGYDVNGGLITFYKNCQVELGLPKDSIRICVPSNCWGHIFQGFGKEYTLNVIPSPNSVTCNNFGTFSCRMIGDEKVVKETKHQGNTLLLFDYDGDGDMDMLDGNISFNDIQFLRNGRAQYRGTDSMIAQDTTWQTGGHQITMPQWPSASYVDADGDGKSDILITPHEFSSSENYKCVAFYKNTGTAAAPQFVYQNDTFLISQMIDAGTASYPVLYDYNKDGKLDLFVGSDGYYQPDGSLRSRISYYQNQKSGNSTDLVWQTGDFNNLFAQGFAGAAPAFGDLDGDGKDDMVLGHSDGTLSFYKNSAASNNVQPQWALGQLVLKSTANDIIDAGYAAAPFIYDINKDGKPDLLIGNQKGQIVYYQNNATGGVLSLTLMTTRLGNFIAAPFVPGGTPGQVDTFSGMSSVYIGKMDNTNREYLLSGNAYGYITRYTGFQNGNVSIPYSMVDSTYSDLHIGLRSTIAVGDINGDGLYDMVLGNRLGGLSLYKQGPRVNVPDNEQPAAFCTVYPNPAHNTITVAWDARLATGANPVIVSLIDMLGQTVRLANVPAGNGGMAIDITSLASGIYTCHIIAGSQGSALKVSIIR